MLLRGIRNNNNGAGVSARITVSKGLSWNYHKQCDSDVYDIPGTAFCLIGNYDEFPIKPKSTARMRPDACGICLLKQTASGAQSVTSPSKIEGFREFEADLSALFLERRVKREQ